MQRRIFENYFALLRISLEPPQKIFCECSSLDVLSEKEWLWIFREAEKQSLVGLLYCGVQKLPASKRPPRTLLLTWSLRAETLRGLNLQMNEMASKVTQLFESRGFHPVILKGQANARLYPDPLCRQPGDIDVFIEGGRSSVLKTLKEMNLMQDAAVSIHHAHLDEKFFNGITIEVHFLPTSGYSPFKSRNMLRFLNKEISKSFKVDDGFYVPPMTFALVMQLSHLRQHFFGTGLGLRQLADYSLLLRHSSSEDRQRVSDELKNFGLFRMAGAVMWFMQSVFAMPDEFLICPPDQQRGEKLLHVVMNGGNFGWFSDDYSTPVFKRWLNDRKRAIRLMKFDFWEAFWHEILYLKTTLYLIPRRIKRGRIALGNR